MKEKVIKMFFTSYFTSFSEGEVEKGMETSCSSRV
jgi:hypothetical protein